MRIHPDGPLGFRNGASDGETDKINSRLNKLGRPVLRQPFSTGDKPHLRAFPLHESDTLGQALIEQRFSPPFENDVLNISQMGKELLELFERHLPLLPLITLPSDAHLALE